MGESRPAIQVSLPEFTNEKDFKFGRITELGESVAHIMAARQLPESEAHHRQYVLSHGSYKPGEKRSHYDPDWQAPANDTSDVVNFLNSDGSRVKEALYWKAFHERYIL